MKIRSRSLSPRRPSQQYVIPRRSRSLSPRREVGAEEDDDEIFLHPTVDRTMSTYLFPEDDEDDALLAEVVDRVEDDQVSFFVFLKKKCTC